MNIHNKTAVIESLSHKVEELQSCNFIKERLQYRCFLAKFLRNSYFEEHLRTTASGLTLQSDCLKPCFWTVAFKTILTQYYYKNTSGFQLRASNTIRRYVFMFNTYIFYTTGIYNTHTRTRFEIRSKLTIKILR